MIVESTLPKSGLQRPSFPLLLAAVAAVVSLSATAHASSIVVDGGFESAGGGNSYFAGQSIDKGAWTVGANSAVYVDTQDPFVFAGNNSLNLTGINPYTSDSISQTLATIVGQTYDVSFYANSDSSNLFSLTEDGLVVSGTPTSIASNGFPDQIDPNGNSGLFTQYTGQFRATSTTTDLTFTGTSNPAIGDPSQSGSVMLDDVNVAATPEPGSIVLMLTGIASVALMLGKKRFGLSSAAN